MTDTAYDPGSIDLARNVAHLLHEAWSTSDRPVASEGDATAAEAGLVAQGADARRLTLVHLNPRIEDEDELLADARRHAPTHSSDATRPSSSSAESRLDGTPVFVRYFSAREERRWHL